MTSYKIIINFEYFRSMYTWRSKTFASRKKVLSALEEIRGSPANATWKYRPGRIPRDPRDFYAIPDDDKVKIVEIGVYYRKDGQWTMASIEPDGVDKTN